MIYHDSVELRQGGGTPHGIASKWMRVAAFFALFSLVLEHGFVLPPATRGWFGALNIILTAVYSLDLVLALFKPPGPRHNLASRRLEYGALVLFFLLVLVNGTLLRFGNDTLLRLFHAPSSGALVMSLLRVLLVWLIGVQALRAAQRLMVLGMRPEFVLALSFAILIAGGTLLLLLPNASARAERPIGAVDALFTATSAACVTGLTVRDTGSDFSRLGQMIILGLFQAGGLGIITFVAFLSVFSSRALPVPQMVIFRQAVNAPASSDLKRQFIGIVLTTSVIELTGIILLFHFLPSQGDFLQHLFSSVFHSVSAFCNAGFALQPDSLVPFRENPGVILSISLLIVLGGLGFLVIPELLTYKPQSGTLFRLTRSALFRRLTFFRWVSPVQRTTRLSIQAKLALSVMGALLLVGFVGFWLLEANHLLRAQSTADGFSASFFQSITARTAGFNTVPIEQLQNSTLILLMVLMVIGANPVSTGGGIKTVSFGILLLALRAMITRRDRVEAFGRTIPTTTLFAALSVFGIYVLSAVLAVFCLSLTDPAFSVEQQTFEVVSALSTVGLSTGITPHLSVPGKLIICAAMFVGRVGPISLVLSVFHRPRGARFEFPEEDVVVG